VSAPATRLAAWWSAWKWVVLLAVALALSLWGNLRQWRAAATAPLRGEILARDEALEASRQLLQDSQARAAALEDAAGAAATQLRTAGRDYRAAVAARPITDPQCAPGAGRIDAVNRALGAGDQP
jgi:hypothetical protein